MDHVIAVILGGGRGARLAPLTTLRSKPAVPIGGQYRLIDIPISNCLHSEIRSIFVLTQFNSVSLHRHINQTYRFDSFSAGGVELLAAEQTQEHADWYQGTADAVRKQLRRFPNSPDELILILSGDQLYRMDFRELISFHRTCEAEITLAVQPVSGEDARRFGIVKTNQEHRIVRFHEKPQEDDELLELRANRPGKKPADKHFLASMGIYVFRSDVLHRVLQPSNVDDFGRHIIPSTIDWHRVYAYEFDGYWEDIGTMQSFYQANLDLTSPLPRFDLYRTPPFYTRPRFLPGVKMERCRIDRVIIGAGSILVDSDITHSVIGIRSRVGPFASIRDAVIMGADFYESDAQREKNRSQGVPNVGVGSGCVIERAIIDKNARVGDQVRIVNAGGVQEAETDRYVIRDGIVVIPKDAVITPGTII